MCSDKSNKLSDISMADAWNMKCVTEDKNGTSLLVSRNEFSEKFLLDHGLNKEVKIENIPKDFILESQGLYNNKKNIDTRVKLLKKFGYNTPNYNEQLMESDTKDYLNAINYFLKNSLSNPNYWIFINLYLKIIKTGIYFKIKYLKLFKRN